MQNKRGLSTIVATLIIILLVLVAAGIIWVVVRNLISEGAEGIELGRFTLDLSIKAAYIDGTNIKVNVRRSSGEGDLIGVRFIFFNGTGSISVDRNIPLIPTQERLFSFNSSDVGDINVYQEVSVAPIYTSSSGKETIGDITDTATISGSAPPGGNGDNGNGGVDCGNGEIDENEECDGGTGCTDCACDTGYIPTDPVSLNCQSESAPSFCDGIWDENDVGINECDGEPLPTNCNPDCTCSVGFTPDTLGGCDLDPPVNTGIINSVWNSIYFDSQDFPKSQVTMNSYIGYSVNFSGSPEIACFGIDFADYVSEIGTDMSYVRLDDSFGFPNINAGEGYDVWEAENCGA